MMSGCTGQLTVPPGFRFHPTDEELLHYYLRKKVSYEAIDLDVIREVDLNKLEPWDFKDKCRIGSGLQNEWYFYSHKDKKYPTGTRTNRATAAGFWKATGRDKTIHHNSNPRRLGLRKTLVFYTGRAPHGQKTDWIMHEYRLDDRQIIISHNNMDHQEEGWVVCRVFKKKSLPRFGSEQELKHHNSKNGEEYNLNHRAWPQSYTSNNDSSNSIQVQPLQISYSSMPFSAIDDSMQLPQLFSPEAKATTSISPNRSNNNNHNSNVECPHNLLRQMSSSFPASASDVLDLNSNNSNTGSITGRYFLDKLLATNHHSPHIQLMHPHHNQYNAPRTASDQLVDFVGASAQKSQFDYFRCELDVLKFSK